MNSWKDAPHLFANGKFEALDSLNDKFKIFGIRHWLKYTNSSETQVKLIDFHGNQNSIDHCTLIARPISDTTDEEFETIRDHFDKATLSSGLNYKHYWDVVLYVLSIGVYPFNQLHFELPDDDPAKVIDVTKLEVA